MADVSLHLGDCLDVLQTLDANSVDSIVCDPPYGLKFMGKDWDHGVPGVAFWEAALRVAKPGAMLLAFGGTRTFHRLTVAIEDAGWEIRDCLTWLYGSGFPKSHDISKAIDKAAGAEREVVGIREDFAARAPKNNFNQFSAINPSDKGINSRAFAEKMGQITAPATPAARQWDGWGTALKPAYEPIIMARKPLEGTVAANVLKWGVGGINIDDCRIGTNESLARPYGGDNQVYGKYSMNRGTVTGEGLNGRWPANLLLDSESARLLDEQSGPTSRGHFPANDKVGKGKVYGQFNGSGQAERYSQDTGGASRFFRTIQHDEDDAPLRFFYVAKASKRDRDEGLEGMSNIHSTVKPTQLMRYLCRMVTPPNGVILDPFAGSGSTGKAAVLEGFSFVGIELEAEYLAIAERRIAEAQKQLPLLEMA